MSDLQAVFIMAFLEGLEEKLKRLEDDPELAAKKAELEKQRKQAAEQRAREREEKKKQEEAAKTETADPDDVKVEEPAKEEKPPADPEQIKVDFTLNRIEIEFFSFQKPLAEVSLDALTADVLLTLPEDVVAEVHLDKI
jgi:sRNA-binding protein